MSKVSVFGKFTCAEGKEEEMQAALVGLVEVSKEIDGIESYSYHKDDSSTYWFFGLMSNAEAAEKHAQNEKMQAAMGAFMPLLAGQPDMGMASVIAAHGLDV